MSRPSAMALLEQALRNEIEPRRRPPAPGEVIVGPINNQRLIALFAVAERVAALQWAPDETCHIEMAGVLALLEAEKINEFPQLPINDGTACHVICYVDAQWVLATMKIEFVSGPGNFFRRGDQL